MAIPKIKEQDIIDALKYIDENGVPSQNQSTKYELVTEEGKKYPPKYVIAVAAHLATGGDISTDGFNAVEAKSYLQGKGGLIVRARDEIRIRHSHVSHVRCSKNSSPRCRLRARKASQFANIIPPAR